jgi:predicted nucleic acid-binding protein
MRGSRGRDAREIDLFRCVPVDLSRRAPCPLGPVAEAMAGATDARFGISPLVKCECLAGPLKRGDPVLERAHITLFAVFPSLPMPEPVYLQAAQLRARFNLRTPDALHLACAQHHRCAALWTNDDRLAQASHGLARRVLH